MASMRQNIARALIKTRIGLTTREIAEELQLKPTIINMDLAKMAIEGTTEKGEYLEGEGQLWMITEKGVEEYATKEDLKVKKSVEVVEIKQAAKPKNKAPDEIKSIKQVKINVTEKSVLKTEVESFETRAPFSKQEIEELPEPRQSKVTAENFKVWEMLDRFGAEFSELLKSKQSPPIVIDNLEYKIKTLESLSELYNTKIGSTLRGIAVDLRGLSN